MQRKPKEITFEEACDIPEIAALSNDRMRAFVVEYAQNGCNAKAAAISAGYHQDHATILIARADVTEAMFALAKRLFHGGVYLAFHVAMEILADPTQSPADRLKAGSFISDRGGLAAATNIHMKIEKVPDDREMIEKALEAAARLGIDPKLLVGPNTSIPLIAEDPLAGADDL